MKKNIVISAVNLTELGPLSVLKDALQALSAGYRSEYRIIALVHRASLFDIPDIEYLEYPNAKSSWLLRIYWEYFGFRKLSRKLNPYLWFSLHDVTPNVIAEIRAVYCHNPSPFLEISLRQSIRSPRFWVYTSLYKYLYKLNIHKNDWIVVQQEWLRGKFREIYGVQRVIVAHPEVPPSADREVLSREKYDPDTYIFFYPCYPRIFKNIEVIVRAVKLLQGRGITGFEVWLTMNCSENHYALGLAKEIAELGVIKLLGRLSREDVFKKYDEVDCLVFPSLLETWGMPISEFKEFGKPVLLADLSYAHETIGKYDRVAFFEATDEKHLADMMQAAAGGQNIFSNSEFSPIKSPYCASWHELFAFLLRNKLKP